MRYNCKECKITLDLIGMWNSRLSGDDRVFLPPISKAPCGRSIKSVNKDSSGKWPRLTDIYVTANELFPVCVLGLGQEMSLSNMARVAREHGWKKN